MNRAKKVGIVVGLLVAVGGLMAIAVSFRVIYKEVRAACVKARTEYAEDCVGSLIKVAEAENKSFRERNTAIWALGQIADKQALPFLTELEKSLPEQEKCSYDQYVCKYEVQKAIKWCQSGNATRWMYKSREKW